MTTRAPVPVIPAISDDVPLNARRALIALKNAVEYLLAQSGTTRSQFSAAPSSGGGVGGNVTHAELLGLQGGGAGDYFHLTAAQHTDLTDGGDSTAHFHAADRELSNATGTLPWGSVSKVGSSLADLAARAHSQLTGVLGDGGFHLSGAQVSALLGGAATDVHTHDHSVLVGRDLDGHQQYALTSSGERVLTSVEGPVLHQVLRYNGSVWNNTYPVTPNVIATPTTIPAGTSYVVVDEIVLDDELVVDGYLEVI